MNDALSSLMRTNLDLYFGRLAPLAPTPEEHDGIKHAAAAMVRRISECVLQGGNGSCPERDVQCQVFSKKNALPQWLINKGLIVCDNDLSRLEPAIVDILDNDFNKRRFIDFISCEISFHCWLLSDNDAKRVWPVRRLAELCHNTTCTNFNTRPYVVKLGNDILGQGTRKDSDTYHWYIRSLGTVQLIDYATKSIYEHTAGLLEARYKTTFILDVFKKLFADLLHAPTVEHWGVLLLGDIPKTFALADFRADPEIGLPPSPGRTPALTDLLGQVLSLCDDPGARDRPEARFCLGPRPPQTVLDRVGAMFWLRRTLDAVKTIQTQKTVPRRGLRVEERSFLQTAMQQKSLLYCNLFDQRLDPEINPCSIQAIGDDAMVLASPRGNKLNEAREGHEIHGYFAVVDGRRKSTYCDFRTTVSRVTPTGDSHCLVEISLPATFELTRRSHKRLRLDAQQLRAFSLYAPAAEAGAFGNLENWPPPLCRLPDENALCQIKDLSAGGLMLEIHQDAPAFDYFIDKNRDTALFALLHLAGRHNLPDLLLPLCLKVMRIRHYAPLRKKYLGVQFIEAGEIKNQKYVRWQPVSKDGVFLIADWIFRDTIAR